MTHDEFEKLLQHFGHVYVAIEGLPTHRATKRFRHLAKNNKEDLFLLCEERNRSPDEDSDRILMSHYFHHDLNCLICRDAVGLRNTASLTKRSLLVEIVNILVDIEQQFLEAIYWKEFRKDADPINTDNDGVLASAWQEQADQLIQMVERFRPLMQKHEGAFGWPEKFNDDHR